MLKLILVFIFIFSIGIPSVYAPSHSIGTTAPTTTTTQTTPDTPTPDPSLGWQIKKLIYDFHEIFDGAIFGDQSRAVLEAKHAIEFQEDFNRGEISKVVQEAINQKLIAIEEFKSRVTKADTGMLIDTKGGQPLTPPEIFAYDQINRLSNLIREAGAIDDIVISYYEFEDVLERNNPEEIQRFNEDLNDNPLWKKHCRGNFDIRDYRNDLASQTRIITACPILSDNGVLAQAKDLIGY